MGDTQRILIEPTTIRGDRGQRYRVHFAGEILIEDTWNPEFEACRALVVRGIIGRLEVWRGGKARADMVIPDIEARARWTVLENDKAGPIIVPWRPFPEDVEQDAVSSNAVLAPAAENFIQGGHALS
jgi:hypothetical protein